MHPLASRLLEDMEHILNKEDSISTNDSNIREYSPQSNDNNEKEDISDEINWLKSLTINDKLDAKLRRYTYGNPWCVAQIQKIKILYDNRPAYFIKPVDSWIHGHWFTIDFNSETINNLCPLNTHTPIHLCNVKLLVNCHISECNYTRYTQCFFCQRNTCSSCFIIHYMTKAICYDCMKDQFRLQTMKLLSCKRFNDVIEKIDMNVIKLICLYSMGITVKCCNNCENEVNLDIYLLYKWLHSSGDIIEINRRSCWAPSEYFNDICGNNIYKYNIHKFYENNEKYPIQSRNIYGSEHLIRIFCNQCSVTQLQRCKLCFECDVETVCKRHYVCSICDGFGGVYSESQCKVCCDYYHTWTCGMNDYCQKCVKWPIIIHHRSKEDLVSDLQFNRWRTVLNYSIIGHKDSKKIFNKIFELFCKECTENVNINGEICSKNECEYIGVIGYCWCCEKLIVEDFNDAPKKV